MSTFIETIEKAPVLEKQPILGPKIRNLLSVGALGLVSFYVVLNATTLFQFLSVDPSTLSWKELDSFLTFKMSDNWDTFIVQFFMLFYLGWACISSKSEKADIKLAASCVLAVILCVLITSQAIVYSRSNYRYEFTAEQIEQIYLAQSECGQYELREHFKKVSINQAKPLNRSELQYLQYRCKSKASTLYNPPSEKRLLKSSEQLKAMDSLTQEQTK